jgi:hypothetical protein
LNLRKHFEFAKIFSNLANLALVGFKKWPALRCQLFKRIASSETYLGDFKTGKFALASFRKLLAKLRKICYPMGAGILLVKFQNFSH